jgi:glutathione synthase/RimK-type ligase-like ATP-grasp enzyme
MPRVALVTCHELPDLDPDDRLLRRALETRGVEVSVPSWDGPRSAFARDAADLVVIRNTWDYTTRREEFLAFVDDVSAINHLLNPASVIRDNTDKRYLQRLHDRGVTTVPTVFVPQSPSPPTFASLRAQLPAASAYVIKPTVGAGSRDTIKISMPDAGDDDHGANASADDAADAFLARVVPKEAVMLQPFLPSIAQGELSLIYVDGVFSHAVNKIPAAADFRSQPEFGSTVLAAQPDGAVVALAERAVDAVGGRALLFARIDVVFGADGAPCVIEAELTEPSLYLAYDDGAADRVACAIVARLRAKA